MQWTRRQWTGHRAKLPFHGKIASNEWGRTGGQGLFWKLNLHVSDMQGRLKRNQYCAWRLVLCWHSGSLPARCSQGYGNTDFTGIIIIQRQGDAVNKAKKVE